MRLIATAETRQIIEVAQPTIDRLLLDSRQLITIPEVSAKVSLGHNPGIDLIKPTSKTAMAKIMVMEIAAVVDSVDRRVCVCQKVRKSMLPVALIAMATAIATEIIAIT